MIFLDLIGKLTNDLRNANAMISEERNKTDLLIAENNSFKIMNITLKNKLHMQPPGKSQKSRHEQYAIDSKSNKANENMHGVVYEDILESQTVMEIKRHTAKACSQSSTVSVTKKTKSPSDEPIDISERMNTAQEKGSCEGERKTTSTSKNITEMKSKEDQSSQVHEENNIKSQKRVKIKKKQTKNILMLGDSMIKHLDRRKLKGSL